ncbi:MAG: potassium channel family protein [Armatimonadota bacterium]
MKVIILGCGRVGSTLASTMFNDGHDVTIIDKKNESFRRLGPDFKGRMVVGNGVDNEVLKKAGIEQADSFVAVTNGDNTNIMSVQIAKVKFNVPKVIARIYDPIRACAYQEMGVETICTTVVGARLINDYLLGKEWGLAADYCMVDDIQSQL